MKPRLIDTTQQDAVFPRIRSNWFEFFLDVYRWSRVAPQISFFDIGRNLISRIKFEIILTSYFFIKLAFWLWNNSDDTATNLYLNKWNFIYFWAHVSNFIRLTPSFRQIVKRDHHAYERLHKEDEWHAPRWSSHRGLYSSDRRGFNPLASESVIDEKIWTNLMLMHLINAGRHRLDADSSLASGALRIERFYPSSQQASGFQDRTRNLFILVFALSQRPRGKCEGMRNWNEHEAGFSPDRSTGKFGTTRTSFIQWIDADPYWVGIAKHIRKFLFCLPQSLGRDESQYQVSAWNWETESFFGSFSMNSKPYHQKRSGEHEWGRGMRWMGWEKPSRRWCQHNPGMGLWRYW
jgi:hypothetical protein